MQADNNLVYNFKVKRTYDGDTRTCLYIELKKNILCSLNIQFFLNVGLHLKKQDIEMRKQRISKERYKTSTFSKRLDVVPEDSLNWMKQNIRKTIYLNTQILTLSVSMLNPIQSEILSVSQLINEHKWVRNEYKINYFNEKPMEAIMR